MKKITFIDKVLDEKYWSVESAQKHYSGHLHYRSPYECDDTCATCDGAKCEYCREIIDPAHLEFGIASDELVELLINIGVPQDCAEEYVYTDGYYDKNKYGYDIKWPTEDDLKEYSMETYKKFTSLDEDILKVIKEFDTGDIPFGNVCLNVREKLTGKASVIDFNSHLEKQLILYWVTVFEPRINNKKSDK